LPAFALVLYIFYFWFSARRAENQKPKKKSTTLPKAKKCWPRKPIMAGSIAKFEHGMAERLECGMAKKKTENRNHDRFSVLGS
jgi:hypothetical protein